MNSAHTEKTDHTSRQRRTASPRRNALELLLSVTEEGKYSNLSIKEGLGDYSETDSRFIAALVYGTLDKLFLLDFIISKYTDAKLKPQIRGILRMGLYQAFFMRIPVSAACNESVKLAKEIGKSALSGFVNGVMRNAAKCSIEELLSTLGTNERLSVEYSFPKFMVDEYVDLYGTEFAEKLLDSLSSGESAGMTLRAQPPYTVKQLGEHLSALGLPYKAGLYSKNALISEKGFKVSDDALFKAGGFTVQSESAMLVCYACGAKPGMSVLDACAAPGGKTACLAAAMQNTGTITALELHPHRTALMEASLKRLNVTNAECVTADASVFNEAFADSMDVVLVDAPCSGLGVTGKPDARYDKTPARLEQLAKTQYALLETCSRYVKNGGALVYSTCTISKRENEDVAAAFIKAHPEFRLGSLAEYMPEALKERAKNGTLQLFPSRDGTDGFFIARMEKNA